MKHQSIALLMLLLLSITACTPALSLRDEAFLPDTSLTAGEPCEAPCWQDLIPGETVWGVAVATVEDSEDYRQTDSEDNRRTPEDWIEFAYRDGPTCCRIYSADGETLSAILILVAPQMTLGEVVTRYGEPTYMTAQAQTSDQAQIALVYPDLATVVYAFAPNITTAEVTAESEIIGHVYMAPSEMETLLASENLYTWDGYGALSTVIDGEFDLTPLPIDDAENQDLDTP
ncbi:MAG: hypothetical protein AAFV98_15185 [Chloroflexota bacterium]